MNTKSYQMDVKCAFLNGYLQEGICRTTSRFWESKFF